MFLSYGGCRLINNDFEKRSHDTIIKELEINTNMNMNMNMDCLVNEIQSVLKSLSSFSSRLTNLQYFIFVMNSHIHFQLLDNGVMRSLKRRKFNFLSLVFTGLN